MITAQEARATKSDRYEDMVDTIDLKIRSALKRGEKSIDYYAPYDEDVWRALEEHGFTVNHSRDPRDGDCWRISW